jgi:outer membrane protein OmpA-like peptidoglycan-associated protein
VIYQQFDLEIVNSFCANRSNKNNHTKMEHLLLIFVREQQMKYFCTLLLVFFSLNGSFARSVFDGTWQGILLKAGQNLEQGTVLYADFELNDGILSGTMREEAYENNFYALKLIKGTVESKTLNYTQIATLKKKKSSKMKWCRNNGALRYDSTTGYLTGTFNSTDCRRFSGTIILYRNDFEMSKEDQSHLSHIWFNRFIQDYKEGLSAPDIRDIERNNFVFKPLFFDFDRSEIREEHKAFLDALIKVVKGHSDLRVRVTGHTDAEGTNGYNIGLSKRRAEAIVNYFVAHGLKADRLKFDFHGEKKPIATNKTPEGRQRNRRVDFEFI